MKTTYGGVVRMTVFEEKIKKAHEEAEAEINDQSFKMPENSQTVYVDYPDVLRAMYNYHQKVLKLVAQAHKEFSSSKLSETVLALFNDLLNRNPKDNKVLKAQVQWLCGEVMGVLVDAHQEEKQKLTVEVGKIFDAHYIDEPEEMGDIYKDGLQETILELLGSKPGASSITDEVKEKDSGSDKEASK